MPISFYADLVSSQSFKTFNKDRQNEIFGRVFRTIGVESFEQLEQLEPEKVAYNHEALKTIFGTYFAVNKKNNEQEKAATELLNTTISNKLQAMVDLAPALSEDPEKRATMTTLSARHKGDLSAASEEVLGLFADTKPLTKANLTAMGLNQNFEQHSVTTAKAVLAQYKLSAYAEAAKALGIVSEENAA